MKQFYLHDGQNQIGPFSTDELKEKNITRDTYVWKQGMTDWIKASEVSELNTLFAAIPPPFKNLVEEKTSTAPKFEPSAYSSPYTGHAVQPTKRKLSTPLIIGSVIIVCGIIGWLIYQNQNQQAKINEVQSTITQQQDEQYQKEQQAKIEEQKIQGEKDRINAANTEKYMGYRNNWKAFIGVTNSPYNYVPAGGISDLIVNVKNITDKIVDEVQVRVDYIKANGGIYKSETVSVTNIGPNSTKSMSAPTSDRGTSVKAEIISITAKSFHFCYPSGMEGNQNTDPYFCK